MRRNETLLLILFLVTVANLMLALNVRGNPDFVSEDSNFITVENAWYIAKVEKGWHGGISQFYIKPNTTENIVALGQWRFLGGDEVCYRFNETSKISVDWGFDTYKASQTTSIVYQTENVAVTESICTFKPAYVQTTWVEYIAWFKDYPYYLVTHHRTFAEELEHVYNYQHCLLFNDTWASTFYRIDHNGTLDKHTTTPEQDLVCVWEAQYLQKYPWAMMYNTTFGTGHFSILLSGNPNHISIGMYAIAASQYHEYQISFSTEYCEDGDTWSFSLLNGVAQNTTYVDNLASILWADDVVQADADNYQRVSSNPEVYKSDYRFWRLTNQVGAYFYTKSTEGKWGDEGGSHLRPMLGNEHNAQGEWKMSWQFTNATSYYSVWNWTDFAINQSTYSLSSSFTNATWYWTYQNKWKIETTYEVWKNSDSFYLTQSWTALQTLNVTDIKFILRVNENQTYCDITTLNSTVMKVNVSSTFVDAMHDNGVILQDVDGVLDKFVTDRHAEYSLITLFLRDAAGDAEFPEGTKWSVKMLVQPFRRYTSQSLGYVRLSDIHLPEEGYSETLLYHHKLCWPKFPLTDPTQTYRINNYGRCCVVSEASTPNSDTLTLTVAGPTGSTSEINIYVGDKGQPRRVDGAQSWSYNSTNEILTITALHSSEISISVRWRLSADINDDGIVNATDLTLFCRAFGSTGEPCPDDNWNPDVDLHPDDLIQILDLFVLAKNYGKKTK